MSKFGFGWNSCMTFMAFLELSGVLGKTLSEIGIVPIILYIAGGFAWYYTIKVLANWAGRSKT